MASQIRNRLGAMALGLAMAITVSLALRGQTEARDTASLTLKEVKQHLKENKNYLNEAKKKAKAGDAAGLETALANYERGMLGLDRALEGGQFQGSVYEREEAFNRVEEATRKHSKVLSDLLESGKIPDQAREHIEHAMEVSQKGHDTATAKLAQARTQRMEHEAAQRRQGMGQPGMSRQPGSMGRPDTMGGPPAGVGMPGGMGGGPSGTPGAGHAGGRGPG